MFRSHWAESTFENKYKHEGCETWAELAKVLVEDVCRDKLTSAEKEELTRLVRELKFIPGGRYLYYAGRPKKFFCNCFLLSAEEDTREDWANLSWKVENCLMTGGGIGVDYSTYRDSSRSLSGTGGYASGPIPKMQMVNEIGRNVMQGASRRSAMYASLGWKHGDIQAFLRAKNWNSMPIPGTKLTIADAKREDFNFPAPLDMTNISVNYDTEWYLQFAETGDVGDVFRENVRQALSTAEPGFSFNFFDKEGETLRNAPVAADTHVLTDSGYVQVGSIVGEEVTVWTGFQWAPTTFRRTKIDAPTVKVRFTGQRAITCDPEHEFFVWRGSGVEKVPASNLQPGDHLDVSLPVAEYIPDRDGRGAIVQSVTPDLPQDVFCCDVGVEEHSFVAEGVRVSNCCEITSEDDGDCCNLGSINLGRIESLQEMRDVVRLATKFLVCGTLVADLPYPKVYEVREKNRRLGLGLMGLHEWLLKRGYQYEVPYELHNWLRVYEGTSNDVADGFCDELSISRPAGKRAIAPTGTIGILAGTTTGIEPLLAVAYKRLYLKGGRHWHYQYVIDGTAQELIGLYGVDPNEIETALSMADDFERRIRFQAVLQQYVDHAISSTINLPEWGSDGNNEDKVEGFAKTLAHYAPRLRGATFYPDGARGGQPIVPVDYDTARGRVGVEFTVSDICELTNKGGTCGV